MVTNNLFFKINNYVHNKDPEEMEEIGKHYYQKIADLRFSLENSVKTGLYNLHDIKKAFKTKKNNDKRYITKE